MMKVGTKELKNRLSHYLRVVRAGEPVRVTDRGRIVAELKRAAHGKGKHQGDAEALQELAARGLVTLGHGRPDDFQPVRLRKRVRASQIILEDRG